MLKFGILHLLGDLLSLVGFCCLLFSVILLIGEKPTKIFLIAWKLLKKASSALRFVSPAAGVLTKRREISAVRALARLRQIGPMLGVALILIAWAMKDHQYRSYYQHEFKAWKVRSEEYQRVMEAWLTDHPYYRRIQNERSGF